VTEERKTLSAPVTHEEVRVERVPINRPVTNLPPDAWQDKDIDVPVRGEELVTEKRAKVSEEVPIKKQRVTDERQVTGTVRNEWVRLDREGDVPISEQDRRGSDDHSIATLRMKEDHMNFLDQLLGGDQQQQDYQGSVQWYQQGPPSEGFSGQEAMDRYNQGATKLPPQQYMQAAQAAFANMPPEHRSQLGQFLAQAGQQKGLPIGGEGNYQDPTSLAQMATQMHQQQPGMLGQVLGDVLGAAQEALVVCSEACSVAALAAASAACFPIRSPRPPWEASPPWP
jgi:uncharacterized protein (TIGR02271 family)